MYLRKQIFLLLTGLLPAGATRAQQRSMVPSPPVYKAEIRVIARSYGDSIVLRWAPTTAWAWQSLNYTGYLIERIDLSQAGHPQRKVVTGAPLKPFTLEQFRAGFNKNNLNAAMAAQCLYGKNFNTNLRQGAGAIKDQADVLTNRYTVSLRVGDYDAGVAAAQALRFTDKQVQKNGVYVYRVYPAGPVKPAPVDTGTVLVQNTGKEKLPRPRLSAITGADKMSELHWSRSQEGLFSAFYIERSDDGRSFTQLNKTPFLSGKPDSALLKKDSTKAKVFALLQQQHVFIDSLPRNYYPYAYRIRGVDAFAEWSDYSDTLTVAGRDLTPPGAPVLEMPRFVKGRQINVKWSKSIKEGDFKGYYVTRARKIEGPYLTLTDKLLAPETIAYTDEQAYEHGSNFYMVVAVDTAGNISSSLPGMGIVPDKTPPAAPGGLTGRVEKNGMVHLSWNRNKEEDIKGYKVYFANSAEDVYAQVTTMPLTDSVFTDSIPLRTLTKNIWYKVVAVDENDNNSAYSASLKLRRPDIVPPVPPLTQQVNVDSAAVRIAFIQSASNDVVQYIVYRKKEAGDWEPIQHIKHHNDRDTFQITDITVKPFVNYQYSAVAVDEDSLQSGRSSAVSAMIRTRPIPPPLRTLTVQYDAKSRTALLKWQHKDTGEYFYVIYRAQGEEPMMKYRSADASSGSFTDLLSGKKGQTIRYAVQVQYRDGRGSSGVSEPVTVRVVDE